MLIRTPNADPDCVDCVSNWWSAHAHLCVSSFLWLEAPYLVSSAVIIPAHNPYPATVAGGSQNGDGKRTLLDSKTKAPFHPPNHPDEQNKLNLSALVLIMTLGSVC